jgi:hypothetical protein
MLAEHVEDIKDWTVGNVGDWEVEKFCFIFRGQKLMDLWCKPVLGQRNGKQNDPLKEDYLVVHLVARD